MNAKSLNSTEDQVSQKRNGDQKVANYHAKIQNNFANCFLKLQLSSKL